MDFRGLQNRLQHAWVLVALTKSVIDVNVLSGVLELSKKLAADRRWVLLLGALVFNKTFISGSAKDAIPVGHFNILAVSYTHLTLPTKRIV